MDITLRGVDLLGVIVAVAVVYGAWALGRLSRQSVRTGKAYETLANELTPHLTETLEVVRQEVRTLQRLTARWDRLSERASDTAVPLLDDLERLQRSKTHLTAAAKGLQVGFEAWKRAQDSASN